MNNVLYANDPDNLPITDFDNAASMPYDTDISEQSDIPEDPEVALKQNALRVIRNKAEQQVKKMAKLVDDIAATAIKNSVMGETLETNSPLGAKMVLSK